MRLRLIAIPLLLAFALTGALGSACSGGDDDDGGDPTPGARNTPGATRTASSGGDGDSDLEKYEDELRETAPEAVRAIFTTGSVEAYSYASEDFKDKCSLAEFVGLIGIVKLFLGEIEDEDLDVSVADIRFEDDRAYVTMDITIAGEDFSDGEDTGDLGDYWVYEDGEWKWSTDDEAPCESSFDDDGGSDEDATPATGPGSSRSEPAPRGSSVESGGIRVTVLEIDTDAAARLIDLSEFAETPEAGKRAVLLRVRAEHTGGDSDETIEVSESNFKLTGSAKVLYDTFEQGCGFYDGAIDGELFAGGSTEGYVCFTVPSGEADLLLVFEPNYGFDQGERRYLALE